MHIPPGYSNCTFVIQRAGDTRPYTSSFGLSYAATSAFVPAEADSLVTAFMLVTKINVSSSDTIVSVDFDYNDGAGVLPYSSLVNTVGTGSSSGQVTSQNNAALFIKRSNLPGRKGRGRMFWPYLAETDVDNLGVLPSTTVTRFQTMLTGWRAAVTASTFWDDMRIFHTLPTPDPALVTSLSVSPLIGSQRRRLRR